MKLISLQSNGNRIARILSKTCSEKKYYFVFGKILSYTDDWGFLIAPKSLYHSTDKRSAKTFVKNWLKNAGK